MFERVRRVARAALTAALALAAVAAAPPRAAAEEQAAPTMWRLSDGDNTVWIFGSLHLLPDGVDWRRPELEAALADAEVLFLEIEWTDENVAAMTALTYTDGVNPPGVALSTALSAEGLARLQSVLGEVDATLEQLEWMRPWLALSEIEFALADAYGMTMENGVDFVIEAEAIAAGKEIRSLDTPEQIIGATSRIPYDLQVEILEASLILYERHPSYGDALIAAWRMGDVDEMERLYAIDAGILPPIFDEALLSARNKRWAREIDAFMAGADDALVVVGAFHMVGPDSLIPMLEARGWEVERY